MLPMNKQNLANATALPSPMSSSLGENTGKGTGIDDNDEKYDEEGTEEEKEEEDDDGLSFYDIKDVFNEMANLMDGPFPVPTLDQFVELGSAVAGDLGEGAYGKIVNSMESGWTFGNIITQGTLHFSPAGDPAVG